MTTSITKSTSPRSRSISKFTHPKQKINTRIKGELEIDHIRGVIYFHASNATFIKKANVITALRICSLPKPIPDVAEHGMLDVTHMIGADWGAQK